MKDQLQFIIASIVDKPEEIKIDETEENGLVHFSIKVAKEDLGKVIGKEGKIIRAIRSVMRIPAMKQGKKITISLDET